MFGTSGQPLQIQIFAGSDTGMMSFIESLDMVSAFSPKVRVHELPACRDTHTHVHTPTCTYTHTHMHTHTHTHIPMVDPGF